MDLSEALISPGKAFATKIASYFPNILAAILILVGGWFLARLCKVVTIKLLMVLHFDTASEKAGLDELFVQGRIEQSPLELLGELVYWLVMVIAFMAAINALGLQIASQILNDILLYIPRIIAAIVILVLGLFFANLLAGAVKTGARLAQSEVLSQVVRYGVIVLAAAMALQELDIATQIVTAAFILLFGSICLALAIAFGLGCKDLAAKLVAEQLEKSQRLREEKEGKP
ncbi:MAG: mechanosensitive ion channel [candidate division NC10 bacterium]|nr:mechanosensitive ion channel [candidate division NC10 bacterium]